MEGSSTDPISREAVREATEWLRNSIHQQGGAQCASSFNLSMGYWDTITFEWVPRPEADKVGALWRLRRDDRMALWRELGPFERLEILALGGSGSSSMDFCPLELEEFQLLFPPSSLQHLTSLSLSYSLTINDDIVTYLAQEAKCGPKLVHLTLGYLQSNLSDVSMEALSEADCFRGLKVLQLCHMGGGISNSGFSSMAMAGCGEALETLSLAYFSQEVTDFAIGCLSGDGNCGQRLTALHLGNLSPHVTNHSLQSLCEAGCSSGLASLSLKALHTEVNDDCLEYFDSDALTHLSLHYVNITDNGLRILSGARLHSLELEGLPGVTDRGLMYISGLREEEVHSGEASSSSCAPTITIVHSECLSDLRKLVLSDLGGISNQGIKYLTQGGCGPALECLKIRKLGPRLDHGSLRYLFSMREFGAHMKRLTFSELQASIDPDALGLAIRRCTGLEFAQFAGLTLTTPLSGPQIGDACIGRSELKELDLRGTCRLQATFTLCENIENWNTYTDRQRLAKITALSPLVPQNFVPCFLVGTAYAGKTALARSLLGIPTPPNIFRRLLRPLDRVRVNTRTLGLDILSSDINFWNSGMRFVFWDFGGHAIFHAAHEFFMDQPTAIKILVLSPFQGPNPEKFKSRLDEDTKKGIYASMMQELNHWVAILRAKRRESFTTQHIVLVFNYKSMFPYKGRDLEKYLGPVLQSWASDHFEFWTSSKPNKRGQFFSDPFLLDCNDPNSMTKLKDTLVKIADEHLRSPSVPEMFNEIHQKYLDLSRQHRAEAGSPQRIRPLQEVLEELEIDYLIRSPRIVQSLFDGMLCAGLLMAFRSNEESNEWHSTCILDLPWMFREVLPTLFDIPEKPHFLAERARTSNGFLRIEDIKRENGLETPEMELLLFVLQKLQLCVEVDLNQIGPVAVANADIIAPVERGLLFPSLAHPRDEDFLPSLLRGIREDSLVTACQILPFPRNAEVPECDLISPSMFTKLMVELWDMAREHRWRDIQSWSSAASVVHNGTRLAVWVDWVVGVDKRRYQKSISILETRFGGAADGVQIEFGRLRDELLVKFEERIRKVFYPKFSYQICVLPKSAIQEAARRNCHSFGSVEGFPEGDYGCGLLKRLQEVLDRTKSTYLTSDSRHVILTSVISSQYGFQPASLQRIQDRLLECCFMIERILCMTCKLENINGPSETIKDVNLKSIREEDSVCMDFIVEHLRDTVLDDLIWIDEKLQFQWREICILRRIEVSPEELDQELTFLGPVIEFLCDFLPSVKDMYERNVKPRESFLAKEFAFPFMDQLLNRLIGAELKFLVLQEMGPPDRDRVLELREALRRDVDTVRVYLQEKLDKILVLVKSLL